MSKPVFCHGCGQPLEIPEGYEKNKIRCPQCGVFCEVPPDAPRSRKPPAEKPRKQPPPPAKPKPKAMRPAESQAVTPAPPRAVTAPPRAKPTDDEDDGQPYTVEGGEEKRCPKCGKILDEGAVLCLRCGFNSETGEKAKQTFQPILRHWESGWWFQSRVIGFIIFEAVAVLSGGIAILLGGDPCTFVVTWTTFTVMLAFLLGTWDTLDLERNAKGRIKLIKTWRVFFITARVIKINLGEYEGVITGRTREVNMLDWFMFFLLFGFGIIPGLIFFYLAFFKDSFYVCLVRDHGNPAVTLYKGGNEAQMKDIEAVVSDCGRWKVDVSGLK